MSDFDKEAEREKLRKKFAKDEEKRKQTQRMSELLLQGATMTNKHCDRCGDPIFRHNDQEFCPTCKAEDSDRTNAQQPNATNNAHAVEQQANSDSVAVEPTEAADASRSQPQERSTETSTAETQQQQPRPSQQPKQSNPTQPQPSSQSSQSGAAELDDVRTSLRRTIRKFTVAAEQTDDPRRARELLSAAREAAETLNTIR
ncbi:Sjogren's syndrome/scleroderma autoantigen 1 family protein [Natronocalculus amylovorans]|uniref:Sjogren's syndrome/scleroderma autoantigen 1 (Autoantigen p27) n=1 Tax=Natronocalculus amylovorans TaxID=2917812 RepID=A0AAE3FW23_9EURY|nr:Sjogren's syndrome/scleroderma autoantigen 1 family protein [Natronocalculus amylovorans]MCL9816033.1 hypothetical protein [Natronocalculus amylovorans]NUE01450.1 hypothetical protein [Halorubraceae archaeon YAN]